MFNRLLDSNWPQSTFFLFGPRQIGKSTLLSKYPSALAIDLLDPQKQLTYTQNPNLLADQVKHLPQNSWIILDEIQKVPKLLDVVHGLMEAHTDLKFILCGSSARKLRHGAANLLGGRALYRTLYPLTYPELGNAFDLEKVLSYGSLPKIYTLLLDNKNSDVEDLLRSYVITYLREEIKSEALVRNLQGFQNFLDVASAQFSEQINFSSVSRDCQVALSTVKEYYSILEDTLIGFFLRPYTRSERKRMSHQPKFYFFDNGVTRALTGVLRDAPTTKDKGRLFEQWVVQEFVRRNDYEQKDWKLFFWRTNNGAEVDLIVVRGAKILYAVECKSTPHLSSADVSGLKSFHQEYPDVPCYVLAPVDHSFSLGCAKVLPWQKLWEEFH